MDSSAVFFNNAVCCNLQPTVLFVRSLVGFPPLHFWQLPGLCCSLWSIHAPFQMARLNKTNARGEYKQTMQGKSTINTVRRNTGLLLPSFVSHRNCWSWSQLSGCVCPGQIAARSAPLLMICIRSIIGDYKTEQSIDWILLISIFLMLKAPRWAPNGRCSRGRQRGKCSDALQQSQCVSNLTPSTAG